MVKEVARITDELVSARDIANGVVAAIRADLAQLRAEGNEDNLQQIELRQLERNADASRQVLEEFQKRAAETSQFESLQFSDARVITDATAPLRPVWPKGGLILIVASVLGLVAGCAAALFAGPRKASVQPAVAQPAADIKSPPGRRPFLPMLLSRLRLPRRVAKASRPARKPVEGVAARSPANGKLNGHTSGAATPGKGRPPAGALARPAAAAAQPKAASIPPAGNGRAETRLDRGLSKTSAPAPGAAASNGMEKRAAAGPPPIEGPSAAAIEAAVKEVRRRRGFADLN
jgi:hypothetical protein